MKFLAPLFVIVSLSLACVSLDHAAAVEVNCQTMQLADLPREASCAYQSMHGQTYWNADWCWEEKAREKKEQDKKAWESDRQNKEYWDKQQQNQERERAYLNRQHWEKQYWEKKQRDKEYWQRRERARQR